MPPREVGVDPLKLPGKKGTRLLAPGLQTLERLSAAFPLWTPTPFPPPRSPPPRRSRLPAAGR